MGGLRQLAGDLRRAFPRGNPSKRATTSFFNTHRLVYETKTTKNPIKGLFYQDAVTRLQSELKAAKKALEIDKLPTEVPSQLLSYVFSNYHPIQLSYFIEPIQKVIGAAIEECGDRDWVTFKFRQVSVPLKVLYALIEGDCNNRPFKLDEDSMMYSVSPALIPRELTYTEFEMAFERLIRRMQDVNAITMKWIRPNASNNLSYNQEKSLRWVSENLYNLRCCYEVAFYPTLASYRKWVIDMEESCPEPDVEENLLTLDLKMTEASKQIGTLYSFYGLGKESHQPQSQVENNVTSNTLS